MQVFRMLLIGLVFALAQTLNANAQKSCGKRLDIVFAVDTTSSQTSADFETVKSEVKKIASNFTVKPHFTRMALVSIARTASVMADFDAVKSLSDFDAAVDKLSFSTDTADLSEGIKVARDSIMDKARKNNIPLILILVKDRRSAGSLASDSGVLSRITSEAQLVKNLGATINTVGIGGLWATKEVEAVYGTDYLMFKDKEKALKSIKSFDKTVDCQADCPLRGKSFSESGMCFGSLRHVITERVGLGNNANLMACRTEIDREFQTCTDDKSQRCNDFIGERKVSNCRQDSKLTVTVTIQSFDSKKQKCETTKKTSDINCDDIDNCPGQKADVIIIVDRSGSIKEENFPLVLEATADLVRYLNVGPDNANVGVISFGVKVYTEIELGTDHDMRSLLHRITDRMPKGLETATQTHLAIKRTREEFTKNGRPGVGKYVFLITDGGSDDTRLTLQETKLLKDMGVVLYCIGVGEVNVKELTAMTVPEANERLILLSNFSALTSWSRKFSKEMCHKTSPPDVKLCDDNVFVQSVSKCMRNTQDVTSVKFAYDTSKKCIKSTQTQTIDVCSTTCISPTDGNEYLDGNTWTSLCYQFKCEGTTPKVLSSKCIAADGTCKDIGSPPFRCRDHASNEIDNCQCATNGSGKAYLVIDKN